jgi:hypothetical protein
MKHYQIVHLANLATHMEHTHAATVEVAWARVIVIITPPFLMHSVVYIYIYNILRGLSTRRFLYCIYSGKS